MYGCAKCTFLKINMKMNEAEGVDSDQAAFLFHFFAFLSEHCISVYLFIGSWSVDPLKKCFVQNVIVWIDNFSIPGEIKRSRGGWVKTHRQTAKQLLL